MPARTEYSFAALALGAVLALAAAGCGDRQVARGAVVFKENCASCHGAEGAGANPARPWGAIDPAREGFIAPALDGRGHCSDHPRAELLGLIVNGSVFPGSPMPAFKDKLSESDQAALVAYLESLWDRATRRWYELREQQLAKGSK